MFLQGSEHMQGASTITQQVAEFPLTCDREVERKVREILLSLRIEAVSTSDSRRLLPIDRHRGAACLPHRDDAGVDRRPVALGGVAAALADVPLVLTSFALCFVDGAFLPLSA